MTAWIQRIRNVVTLNAAITLAVSEEVLAETEIRGCVGKKETIPKATVRMRAAARRVF